MSVDYFVILFFGFIVGFGFSQFIDFCVQAYCFFERKNREYSENKKKKDEKSKKEEVEK